jgi:Flp pilus assembly protein TadD
MVCLFLILATISVFGQLPNHDFVNYDDPVYVSENPNVQTGLTGEGIIWAFTSSHASNWHPLTWLSHILDCQIYGLNAGGHHLTSLLFHVVNTLLVFVVFKRMTGALWQSAFVAAMFALHPLHVESVAWVAERKDVLSTFFWMITMWAYIRYVERPGFRRYMLVFLFLALGLMAKPMLVSLPFVLLLMDYWPLNRFQCARPNITNSQTDRSPNACYQRSFALLILEKAPLVVLATVSGIVTFLVQRAGGAVCSSDVLPLQIRLANALVSYVSYFGKFIWPLNLSVFYPHPGMRPIWQVAVCLMLLLGLSVLVLWKRHRCSYLTTGWLWYLGTLVPVIGVVQVGAQSMADRYTYVPLIGLFIIIAWGVADLVSRWRYRRLALVVSAGLALVLLGTCTWLQVRYWNNSITLFEHALDVADKNYLAHNNLGLGLAHEGRLAKATVHYSKALQIKPDYAKAHINLGGALARQGEFKEAIGHYLKALQISPNLAEGHNNLGVALTRQGEFKEGIGHYLKALQIKPDYADAFNNLGNALAQLGRLEEAISCYSEAVRMKPDLAEGYNNLGVALERQGILRQAIVHYSKALQIKPDYAEARHNLRLALRIADERNRASR